MLSLQLADFGAEVVKVESPGRGDTLRDWREAGVSVHWKVYARNKKSITLDLKAPEAPGIILDLVSHFDVMIESFRFRYLERLGVGPDILLERNPKLVLVRVSGFGQTGPYAKRPGSAPSSRPCRASPRATGSTIASPCSRPSPWPT
jgi:crotonobetainyl-CoA:carnitine CoA-transferase CaiB-like acyl-CoA transferase